MYQQPGLSRRLAVLQQRNATRSVQRLFKLVQQLLSSLQVARIETFREPVVDRREQMTRITASAALRLEARQAHRGAQLPALCALSACNFQRFEECSFSLGIS